MIRACTWEAGSFSDFNGESRSLTGIITGGGGFNFPAPWESQYVGTMYVNGNSISASIVGYAAPRYHFLDGSSVGNFYLV